MEQSIFIEYVKKYFTGVVTGVVETLNGTTDPNATNYLHRTMLRPEFSVSGKWESLNINGTIVAADYVAMDSSLPLKIRDSYGKASGDIPKMGMELQLNEQQLTDLDTMVSMRLPDDAIAVKLFQDTRRCIAGIYEKNELAFLLGLSTGVTLLEDDKNVGAGIRIDYRYPAANKFGVPVVWTNTSSTPLSDISNRILAKASSDGRRVIRIMTDKATIQNIAKTTEAKDLVAISVGNFGTTKPVPTLQKLNDAVQAEYGYTFQIVDRSVTIERDGVRSVIKPWAAGACVALTSEIVGGLFYAKLAEENHPVPTVTYERAAEYILVSKYRQNKPALSEFTSSQARVAPIVSETVYLMDSTTVQA